MGVRLILTICSFFFLLLLLSALFGRRTKVNLGSRLYFMMISVVIALIVSDVLSFVIAVYTDYNLLSVIMLKIHWINEIFAYYLVYIYINVLIYKLNYSNIKELLKNSKYCKIFTIITLVFIASSIVIPFDEISKDNFDFIPGLSAYLVLVYISISILLLLYRLLRKKEQNKQIYTIVYILFVIVIVSFILQFMFRNISFLSLSSAIELYLFFFVIENPDIKLTSEIDDLKNKIEAKSKSKSDFLSNMSHEIRSPMTAIIGFSDTSLYNQNSFDKEKILSDAANIKSSCKNLLDIINNILDISKVETGSDEIHNKEYLLKNLIIDWINIVNARLDNKNIKFELDIDQNMPSKFFGDSVKIYQVVLNLLTNAIKYTEVGKIKMVIRSEKINSNNVKLLFNVSDTGFGIKDEDKSKIFEKFSRLDNAITNEIEGTGLGLALCKKYAELMNGNISFSSEYMVGSSFDLEIPQAVINDEPIGNIFDNITEDNNKPLLNCSGLKVLVVDYDTKSSNVTKRLLDLYNLDVEIVNKSEDCIYNIKLGKQYDLIFLEYLMPTLNGIELLKIIRELKAFTIPPIIMLTASAIDSSRELYLKTGFDEYLPKPIDFNELDRIINKYLNNKVNNKKVVETNMNN